MALPFLFTLVGAVADLRRRAPLDRRGHGARRAGGAARRVDRARHADARRRAAPGRRLRPRRHRVDGAAQQPQPTRAAERRRPHDARGHHRGPARRRDRGWLLRRSDAAGCRPGDRTVFRTGPPAALRRDAVRLAARRLPPVHRAQRLRALRQDAAHGQGTAAGRPGAHRGARLLRRLRVGRRQRRQPRHGRRPRGHELPQGRQPHRRRGRRRPGHRDRRRAGRWLQRRLAADLRHRHRVSTSADPRGDQLADDLRFNVDTDTGVLPEKLQAGDTYTVSALAQKVDARAAQGRRRRRRHRRRQPEPHLHRRQDRRRGPSASTASGRRSSPWPRPCRTAPTPTAAPPATTRTSSSPATASGG